MKVLGTRLFMIKKCESMMHQVANMDYPGNILKVLRKPSAQSSNVADS